MAHIPDISEEVRLELKDVEIFSGEMRFFRKREPADPFAAFSERYGVRLPKTEPEEAPAEDEPPKDEPESAGSLWAHSALGVGLGASQKEISVAYRRLARVHHPDVAGDEERMKWINAAYRELRR
jgi:DnaJ-domain-containing protein 1